MGAIRRPQCPAIARSDFLILMIPHFVKLGPTNSYKPCGPFGDPEASELDLPQAIVFLIFLFSEDVGLAGPLCWPKALPDKCLKTSFACDSHGRCWHAPSPIGLTGDNHLQFVSRPCQCLRAEILGSKFTKRGCCSSCPESDFGAQYLYNKGVAWRKRQTVAKS